jgi:hypothetical protein
MKDAMSLTLHICEKLKLFSLKRNPWIRKIIYRKIMDLKYISFNERQFKILIIIFQNS